MSLVFDRSLVEAVQGIALQSSSSKLSLYRLLKFQSISSSYDLEQVQTCLHMISRLTRNDTIISCAICSNLRVFHHVIVLDKSRHVCRIVSNCMIIFEQVWTCLQNCIKFKFKSISSCYSFRQVQTCLQNRIKLYYNI